MAGIYFHIPFCKKKCNYCDFYSIINSRNIIELVKCELLELEIRSRYINNEIVESIYFGGGTPSLLEINQIKRVLDEVNLKFEVSDDCEITFEANPDDLSEEYLLGLFMVGVNRLSIGIQSFDDNVLRFLGRRHDSFRVVDIIKNAQRIGFKNISVDLIFGIPGFTTDVYKESLDHVLSLNIQHISAYSLSIEKRTLFYKLLKNNKISEVSEEELLVQFDMTIDFLKEKGFVQYEISNYALKEFESRHNSSYWEGVNYLGIGPSAHSYNHISRQWNVCSVKNYCEGIIENKSFFEIELLSEQDKYNEYIITGLRTLKGVSISVIQNNFDFSINQHFRKVIGHLVNDDLIYMHDDRVILSRKGLFISDYIIRCLYYV